MNEAIKYDKCLLCEQAVEVPTVRLYDDAAMVQCRTCGDYEITAEAFLLLLNSTGQEKRYLLSGRARMSVVETGVRHRFDVEEVEALKQGRLRDKTFGESVLSVMRWLAAKPPASVHELEADFDWPIGYCCDFEQLDFLLGQLKDAGDIIVLGLQPLQVQLSGKGWEWLEERLQTGSGPQAFIAMSYAPDMAEVEEALKAGVAAAGYQPILVKDRDFSDGVADRIFAEIRRSHFLVADFTRNNLGVYYEAGFGQGLGLRVIGTCETSHLEASSGAPLHFDVRGLNMIAWKRENLAALTERLTQRIRGMVGQGPVKVGA